jgi:hypothetical protein
MPKYVIEREIPGIGKATPEELKGISPAVVRGRCGKLGPTSRVLHSYVTGDKMYASTRQPMPTSCARTRRAAASRRTSSRR